MTGWYRRCRDPLEGPWASPRGFVRLWPPTRAGRLQTRLIEFIHSVVPASISTGNHVSAAIVPPIMAEDCDPKHSPSPPLKIRVFDLQPIRHGPPGVLQRSAAVLLLWGLEPVHEGQAIGANRPEDAKVLGRNEAALAGQSTLEGECAIAAVRLTRWRVLWFPFERLGAS